MKPQQQIYRILSIFLIVLSAFTNANAQALKTYIDRNSILIGEHIRYELKLNLASSSYKVDFGIPDSIPHFDIIERNIYDTVDEKGIYTMRQTILMTSFDSGIWKLPAFPVTISSPNKAAVKSLSDSVLIQVGYSPADSTNELRDIKPVMDVFVVDRTWIYVAIGLLLLLILAFILYRYFKNRKKKAPPLFDSNMSAYDEAMKALNQLQQQVASADAKAYHTQLSEVFKKYYSRRSNKNLLTTTTSEILQLLATQIRSPEIVSAVAEALRSGDAAKFAKYQPSVSENTQSLSQVRHAIEHLEKKSAA